MVHTSYASDGDRNKENGYCFIKNAHRPYSYEHIQEVLMFATGTERKDGLTAVDNEA